MENIIKIKWFLNQIVFGKKLEREREKDREESKGIIECKPQTIFSFNHSIPIIAVCYLGQFYNKTFILKAVE